MERMKMKDLPVQKRPYEKCRALGPGALSDEELLAVIIRTGSRSENSLELAGRIMELSLPGDGLAGLLHRSLPEFMSIEGIGVVKGLQLCCIGELSRRIWRRKVWRPVPLSVNRQISPPIIWRRCAIWSRRRSGPCFWIPSRSFSGMCFFPGGR